MSKIEVFNEGNGDTIKVNHLYLSQSELERLIPPEHYETIEQWERRTGHEIKQETPVWSLQWGEWWPCDYKTVFILDRSKVIVRHPGQEPPKKDWRPSLPARMGLDMREAADLQEMAEREGWDG